MRRSNMSLAALLAALIAPALGAEPAASEVEAGEGYHFSAKIDARGYIDVFELRRDVALVEPMQTAETHEEYCDDEKYEGDDYDDVGEPGEPLTPEQIKEREERRAAAEAAAEEHDREVQACIERAREPAAQFQAARKALNDAWRPALLAAMQKGDPVAEVIVRQCSTTPVLDRSGVETTCDPDPAKRKLAAEKLRATGFVPALDLEMEPGYWEFGPGATRSPKGRAKLQQIVLNAIEHGSLGAIPYEASGCSHDDPEFTHTWRLIQEAQFRVKQAFTFSWKPDQTDALTLVREPLRATELTWGPATVSSVPDRTFFPSIIANTRQSAGGYTPDVMRSLDSCLGMGLSFADTNEEVGEVVKAEQANVDAYLKQDPRWAVFLMKRIGHHEWAPYDQEPQAAKLGNEWLGRWVLDKTYADFAPVPAQPAGSAEIYLDGAAPRITISVSGQQGVNTSGCALRASGAETPAWTKGDIRRSVLGDLFPLVTSKGYDYLGKGQDWVNKQTGEINGLEPFQVTTARQAQILMQCPEGEAPGTETARFLLLANDTLVEVQAATLHGSVVYVRHYRRAGAASATAAQAPAAGNGSASGGEQGVWDTITTTLSGIHEFLHSDSVLLFVTIVLMFVALLLSAYARKLWRGM